MRKNAIVAGTGYEGRDKIIRSYCKKGAEVFLKRKPKNVHDSNAIVVYLSVPKVFGLLGRELKDIGFIKASTARSLAKVMDSDIKISAHVDSYWAPSSGRDFPRVSITITDEI